LLIAKASEQEPAQIWRVSYPDGGDATRLTNDTSGYSQMSLARDASLIAGAKQEVISSLWTLNPQTKELAQLTSENKNSLGKFGFGLMPDGGLLVSKSERNQTNLWTLNADGKDEKQLTNEDSFNSQGVVSPDGRYIVFASTRNNLNGIWRMDIDGGNLVRLTGAENTFDFKPLILADGKTVVFERRKTDLIKSILMKVSIDGGEATALFNDNPIMETSPYLSDDGKHFAYSVGAVDRANNKFSQTVKIMSAVSGEIGNLEKQFDMNLGWNYKFTPDGKNLIYINSKSVPNLYNMPINGTVPKPLTNFNGSPALSVTTI
jgi:TolB protein